MAQKIRSFIAVELPKPIKSLLDQVQQELKALRFKARWVRAENIHLTLKFLGDVEPGAIDIVGRAMADAAGNCAPLALKIGGLGFFPGVKRPRVIWAGLVGEIPNLLNLQRNLEDRLAAVGIAKENKSFKAHLTLGRMRQAANPDTIRRILKEYTELGEHPFIADRITLFKSDLKPSGAVYSTLKQIELRNK